MLTKHEFALYVPRLPLIVDHSITLTDHSEVHRALKVLRLRIGTLIVLFDGRQALHVTIKVLDKKQLLRERSVIFCALTPTVLRAKQAFVVWLGMFRSML